MKLHSIAIAITLYFLSLEAIAAPGLQWPEKTHYRFHEVEGKKIFYREAGDRAKPTIVLLPGFPSSSHTYRELIPLLSGTYHVIAPDYLGSGFSDHPNPDLTNYTFDLLSKHVLGLLADLGIDSYVLYIQDFGAPVGYRMMLESPGALQALIVQNANAYLDGLTDVRQEFFKTAYEDHSAERVASLFAFVSRDAIVDRQYLRDVKGREDTISPDSWTHDLVFLGTESDKKIQVELFQDYYSNILAYPKWQEFLRANQPPTLIVWGRNDPAFIAAGATAYLRDLPEAEIHLIDAGHFATEEKAVEIAQHVHVFLGRLFCDKSL